jgi:hypothetical protein
MTSTPHASRCQSIAPQHRMVPKPLDDSGLAGDFSGRAGALARKGQGSGGLPAPRRCSPGAGVQFCTRRSDFKGLSCFFCNASERTRHFESLRCLLGYIYNHMICVSIFLYVKVELRRLQTRWSTALATLSERGFNWPRPAFDRDVGSARVRKPIRPSYPKARRLSWRDTVLPVREWG